MKLTVPIVVCRGIYCGKRMNSKTGGGFRYANPRKFAKLDYIECRANGFCSDKCYADTVKKTNNTEE